MRISDCAELTGTTVRTIRYYHQIGLVPVPDRLGGRRDYGLEQVARILRVRWLADAGIPLETVTTMLEEEAVVSTGPDRPEEPASSTSLHDLRATADSLDERLAELTEQRARISALIEMAEQGREFSALPEGFRRFYDAMATRLADPAAIDALRGEQRVAEMFAQRGLLPFPRRAEELLDRMDDEDLEMILRFYTRYAHLPDLPAKAVESEMTQIVDDMVAWCIEHPDLVRDAFQLLPSWGQGRRGLQLLTSFSTLTATHRRQAELLRRFFPAALAVLDQQEATRS